MSSALQKKYKKMVKQTKQNAELAKTSHDVWIIGSQQRQVPTPYNFLHETIKGHKTVGDVIKAFAKRRPDFDLSRAKLVVQGARQARAKTTTLNKIASGKSRQIVFVLKDPPDWAMATVLIGKTGRGSFRFQIATKATMAEVLKTIPTDARPKGTILTYQGRRINPDTKLCDVEAGAQTFVFGVAKPKRTKTAAATEKKKKSGRKQTTETTIWNGRRRKTTFRKQEVMKSPKQKKKKSPK